MPAPNYGPQGTNNFLLRIIAGQYANADGSARAGTGGTVTAAPAPASAVAFGSTTTNALASTFTTLSSTPANKVEIYNLTGKSLKFRRVSTPANVFTMPDTTSKTFTLLANTNELEVASATDGAVSFDWEAVKN